MRVVNRFFCFYLKKFELPHFGNCSTIKIIVNNTYFCNT